MPLTNTELAHHIALALASDTDVVLELRKQDDGSFQAVLDPDLVASIALRILEEEG